MRRRDLIKLIAGFAISWPLRAPAQAPRRIGVLMPFSADDPEGKKQLAAFVQQLHSRGWTEGGNLQIDYRFSNGDLEKMHAYARELVALQPDALFSRGTPVTAALLKNTRSVPIVFALVSDPVGEGFVSSVSHPGGNVTGFANAESSLTGKWLGLLKEVAPTVNRVGFVFDPKLAPGGGAYYMDLAQTAAASSTVTPTAMAIHDVDDITRAIAEFARAPNGGLIVLPDATTNLLRARIIALADQYRLPAIYTLRNVPAEGGLMSYGVELVELFRQAANYLDRILTGAKPADLPVQLPEKFEFVLNLKTAKKLGIAVPSGVVAIADEVIE